MGNNRGIDVLKKDGFHPIPLSQSEDHRGGSRCTALIQDTKGRVWAGTNKGLFYFDKSPVEDPRPHFMDNLDADPKGRVITKLVIGAGGRLWFGTENGLGYIDDQEKIHRVAWTQGLSIWDVLPYEDALLIATNNGLYRFNPSTNAHTVIKLPKTKKPVTALIKDTSQTIWATTRGEGIIKIEDLKGLEKGTAGYQIFQHDKGNPYSLSHNSTRRIYQDRFNMIWVATDASGLNSFDPNGPPFGLIQHQEEREDSLQGNIILCTYKDSRNLLWVGTLHGGLDWQPASEKTSNQGNFTNFRLKNKMRPGTHADNIRAIIEDSQGHLWFSSWGAGLYRLPQSARATPDPTKLEQYVHESSNPKSLGQNYLRFAFEDHHQRLWVGTDREGLSLLAKPAEVNSEEGPTFVTYDVNVEPELAGNRPRSMVSDPLDPNRYWIGFFDGGISRLDIGKDDSFKLYQHHKERSDSRNRVRSLKVVDQTLWVGTDGGLIALSTKESHTKSRTYQVKDGLPNNVIYAIHDDHLGNLWLSTNQGISRFNLSKETFTNYNVFDGLQGMEFNHGASFKDPKGRIYFGGINGLNIVYPNLIKVNKAPPKTVLTDIRVNNNPVQNIVEGIIRLIPSETISSRFTPHLPNGNPLALHLELRNHHKTVSFDFSGLQFIAQEKNRFRYRLQGFDNQWQETNAENRRATYTNLDSGQYSFVVQSVNREGIWDPSGVEISVDMLPPFWLTHWAFMLYALIILAICLSYMARQQYLKQKLTSMVDKKTKDLNASNQALQVRNQEILKAQRQLVLQHKMASVAILTKGVAHEILNPLNLITNFSAVNNDLSREAVEVLENTTQDSWDGTRQELRELMDFISLNSQRVNQHSKRIQDIIDGMKYLSDEQDQISKNTRMDQLVSRAFKLFSNDSDASQVPYKLHVELGAEDFKLDVATHSLFQAILNVLNNSREAIQQKHKESQIPFEGHIYLSTYIQEGCYVLSVQDNGIGIREKDLPYIFDPFFTTKTQEEAHVGLGLYITYEVITKHDGQLKAEVKNGLTTVSISLPFPG